MKGACGLSFFLFFWALLLLRISAATSTGSTTDNQSGSATATLTADYVVVGAGATSAALVHKLGTAGLSVLVLEAGYNNFNDPSIYQTLGSLGVYSPVGQAPSNDPAYSWQHALLPDTGSYGARTTIANGKTWGGGSMINSGVAVRGSKVSWDNDWPAQWNYARIAPYLEQVRQDIRPFREPLKTNATRVFLQAALEIAEDQVTRSNGKPNYLVNLPTYPNPAVEPANGPVQLDYNDAEGTNSVCAFSAYAFTFNKYPNGTYYRQSSGNTYLASDCVNGETGFGTAKCPRLRVVSGAYVDRVVFQGTQATGVTYWLNNQLQYAHARRLVILSGGAYETPALLQRSGVGNATYLASLGIPPVVSNDQVGANLMNHLSWSTLVHFVPTANGTANDVANFVAGASATDGANLGFQAGAFMDYHPLDPNRPANQQVSYRKYQWLIITGGKFFPSSILEQYSVNSADASYITYSLDDIRFASRGKVQIATADPQSGLRIFYNTLVDVADVPTMTDDEFWSYAQPALEPVISAILVYDILYQFYQRMGPIAQERTNGTITVELVYPPLDVASNVHQGVQRYGQNWWHYLVPARAINSSSTAAEKEFAATLVTARRLARTATHVDSHQCGSVQIGKAVDNRLNVLGTSHLKVADLSVFPHQAGGNPVWTAMALGLAASDIVLSEVPSW